MQVVCRLSQLPDSKRSERVARYNLGNYFIVAGCSWMPSLMRCEHLHAHTYICHIIDMRNRETALSCGNNGANNWKCSCRNFQYFTHKSRSLIDLIGNLIERKCLFVSELCGGRVSARGNGTQKAAAAAHWGSFIRLIVQNKKIVYSERERRWENKI